MAKGTQTVSELKRLRKSTLDEIAALQGQLQAEIEPAAAPDDDSVDVAADIYERGKTLSLIQSLEDKLHNIEHAISIANKGSYGICENCGNPIP
ncbi:MAG: TraR/DksA family transcriptional regulator, partial [Anaerolineae bacterium]